MNKNLMIEQAILIIRNQKVILDSDLAELYGVETKVLNQAVKRNIERFPKDFMFRLNKEEDELVTNCDRFEKLKHSSSFPYAFTEHGALMVATILNSPRAVAMSLAIIKTFVKLRQILSVNKDLMRRLDEMEKMYDEKFQIVFGAIKKLMEELPAKAEEPKRTKIGFTG